MQGGSVLGLIAQDCVSNTDRTNHLDQDQHERNLRSVLYYRGLTDTRNQIRLDQHAHGAVSAAAQETEFYADKTIRLLIGFG